MARGSWVAGPWFVLLGHACCWQLLPGRVHCAVPSSAVDPLAPGTVRASQEGFWVP